jgi:AcrR family transcriptional regulator
MRKTKLPTPQQGRPRDRDLDETLVRITLEALGQGGMESVTITKIVRMSGIPATSIYRRYPDARSLVMAAIERDLETLPSPVVDDHGSLRADLLVFLRMFADALTEDRARIIAGLLLPIHHDPTWAAPFIAKLGTMRTLGWQAVIDRAISRGTLREEARGVMMQYDVAQTMIFYQKVVNLLPVDEVFLTNLLDTILLPSLDRFMTDSGKRDLA